MLAGNKTHDEQEDASHANSENAQTVIDAQPITAAQPSILLSNKEELDEESTTTQTKTNTTPVPKSEYMESQQQHNWNLIQSQSTQRSINTTITETTNNVSINDNQHITDDDGR